MSNYHRPPPPSVDQFRGFGEPRSQDRGWGGFFVFFVVPILLAWLLTYRTERHVRAMWKLEIDDRAAARATAAGPVPPTPGAAPRTPPPRVPPASAAAPTSGLAERMWEQYQDIQAREVDVLAELTKLGPAEGWDCDPVRRDQVLEMLARVSPGVYEQWQRAVHPDPPDDQCQG